jgi:hypothetical protein
MGRVKVTVPDKPGGHFRFRDRPEISNIRYGGVSVQGIFQIRILKIKQYLLFADTSGICPPHPAKT